MKCSHCPAFLVTFFSRVFFQLDFARGVRNLFFLLFFFVKIVFDTHLAQYVFPVAQNKVVGVVCRVRYNSLGKSQLTTILCMFLHERL